MDPQPIRWGRGNGGQSAESKSVELLELLELLELNGIGCRESLERTEGSATVGRCSLKYWKSREHNGWRVWWNVVTDGCGMVFLMPTSGFTASNDCNFMQSCLVLFSVGFLILPPTEEQ